MSIKINPFRNTLNGSDLELRKYVLKAINAGRHVVIESPGLESMVINQVLAGLKRKKVAIIHLDLGAIVDQRDFLCRYVTAILKASHSNAKDVQKTIKTLFKGFSPSMNVEDQGRSFSFSMQLTERDIERGIDEILKLPQVIASRKHIRMIVAFEGFPAITDFQKSKEFQEKLRKIIRSQSKVTYIFAGSHRYLMDTLFIDKKAPLNRIGEIVSASNVGLEGSLARFFKKGGKVITSHQIRILLSLSGLNSQCAMALAAEVWDASSLRKKISDQNIEHAVEAFVNRFAHHCQAQFRDLSRHQRSFVCGILDAEVTSIFSQSFIEVNSLGSSANVVKVRTTLINKNIIDSAEGKPHFIDPLFKLWLEQKRIQRQSLK